MATGFYCSLATSGRRWTLVGLLAMVTCCTSCIPPVRVLRHSDEAAALEAQKFADAAFVDRDVNKAHSLLSLATQQAYPLEKFQAELAKMHSSGYPSSVQTTEYQPIPGQPAMSIFLIGENDSGKFFYRLVMEGTQDSGYRVSGFFRGNGPYPASNLRRPLKIGS